MQVLRSKAAAEKAGYCQEHIRRLVKAGKFPAPIRLGEKRVVWIESEIDDWLEGKRQERDAAGGEVRHNR